MDGIYWKNTLIYHLFWFQIKNKLIYTMDTMGKSGVTNTSQPTTNFNPMNNCQRKFLTKFKTTQIKQRNYKSITEPSS